MNAVAVGATARQDALLVRAIELLRILEIRDCVCCSGNENRHKSGCELGAILDEWDKMHGKENL